MRGFLQPPDQIIFDQDYFADVVFALFYIGLIGREFNDYYVFGYCYFSLSKKCLKLDTHLLANYMLALQYKTSPASMTGINMSLSSTNNVKDSHTKVSEI